MNTVADDTRPSRFQQGVLFAIGLVMPIISLQRDFTRWDELASFSQRVAPVDVFTLGFILMLLYARRLRVSIPVVFYLYALIVSAIIAVAHKADIARSLTEFVAVCTALLYLIVGANIGSNRQLVRSLIAGIAVGAMIESVIVAYDLFFGANWFDPAFEGMARGTFRGKNQLGNYGFTAAGLLFTFGWFCFERANLRILVIASGLLAASFPIVAGRRGGMIAIGLWALGFALIGARHLRLRGIVTLLTISLGIMTLMWSQAERIANSLLGRYLIDGVDIVSSGTSFITLQIQTALERVAEWFPLGLGIGRGYTVDYSGVYEMHNGYLSLLVETGVLGLAGFLALIGYALLHFSRSRQLSPLHANHDVNVMYSLLIAYLLACAVLMYHGLLYRDRGFMLLVGLMSGIQFARRPVRSSLKNYAVIAWPGRIEERINSKEVAL